MVSRLSRTLDVSRRERQALDIIYEHGEATAMDVLARMSDAPGYSSVRTLLSRLVRKGHLRVDRQAQRHVYRPAVPRERVRSQALRKVLDVFFNGSLTQAVSALISDEGVTDGEAERLRRLLVQARREGR